jgi:hypothetical protein
MQMAGSIQQRPTNGSVVRRAVPAEITEILYAGEGQTAFFYFIRLLNQGKLKFNLIVHFHCLLSLSINRSICPNLQNGLTADYLKVMFCLNPEKGIR